MNLFNRKIWGDRVTWIIVAAASVAVVYQWQTRGGDLRLYILTGWGLFVAWLLGYSELRIGRKQLRRGRDAMFLGLAAFVGEERTDHAGRAPREGVERVRRRVRSRSSRRGSDGCRAARRTASKRWPSRGRMCTRGA